MAEQETQAPMSETPKTPETPGEQPTSIHSEPRVNWPVIAAAVGLPLIAGLILISLFLLPSLTPDTGDETEEEAPRERLIDRLKDRRGTSEDSDSETEEDDGEQPTGESRTPLSGEPLVKMTVENAEARDAVCNDGTPATYYYQSGSEEHETDWVVFLQGGGGCGDEADCKKRARVTEKYVSSSDYPDTIRQGGILSTDPSVNPDFHDWNHVYVSYCSSDLWAGSTTTTIDGETWHFNGHDIVTAVIEDLQNDDIIEGTSLADGENLVFTGSSAGGAGVILNLDFVANQLPGVNVKGLADSAFPFAGIEAYSTVAMAPLFSEENAVNFQKWVFDPECIAQYPDEAIKCMQLDTLYEHIETPIYFFANQQDQNRLGNLGLSQPYDEAETDWIETVFVPAFLQAAEIVDAIYAPDESFHTIVASERFTTEYIDGVSLAEAFGDWFFGRNEESKYVE